MTVRLSYVVRCTVLEEGEDVFLWGNVGGVNGRSKGYHEEEKEAWEH